MYYVYSSYIVRGETKMEKLKDILFYSVIVAMIAGMIYYMKLPSYTVRSSTNMSASNYMETSLDIDVYKIFVGKSFYEEIADSHNRLNGTPDKLEMNLYLFNRHYRTVVFDYERHMEYTYVGYIPEEE